LAESTTIIGPRIYGRGLVNEIPSPTYDNCDVVIKNVTKVLKHTFVRMADGCVNLNADVKRQVKEITKENRMKKDIFVQLINKNGEKDV